MNLEDFTLDRRLPLALRPPEALVIMPPPLPETLLPEPARQRAPTFPPILTFSSSSDSLAQVKGLTIDTLALPEKQGAQFLRNLRAVEKVVGEPEKQEPGEEQEKPKGKKGKESKKQSSSDEQGVLKPVFAFEYSLNLPGV